MASHQVKLADLTENSGTRIVIGDKEIALFRKGDEVYAIDANCPHRKGPLDGGDLEDEFIVACPWHGWRFDIRTGKSPTHPGQVLCHKVTVADGIVTVEPS